MKIKTILLATLLTLPLALPAMAHPSSECMTDKVIETLELDDGRAEEVRQIMQDFHEKARALHESVRTEMKALHKQRQEQLKQVLTEDEMAKLKEMKARKQKEFHERKGHHHGKHHDGQDRAEQNHAE